MSSEFRLCDNFLYCSFPAEMQYVEKVLGKLKSIPLLANRKKIFFDLSLILREALNNAIVHGADKDISLQIECTVSIDPERISIVVVSPGTGFDWEECLSRDISTCPTQSGWGIFLIREYTDHLSFKEQGKRMECLINMDRYEQD